MTTYTNLGIKQIDTGAEAGTWGTSTNTNFGYFDTSIVGYSSITLSSAGTTGAPNTLNVADYSASNGRNRLINYTDSGSTLGATCYVQITKNGSASAPYFEGYYFIRNSLTDSNLVVFQGTYSAGNAVTIVNGLDAIIRCSGGIVTVVYDKPQLTNIAIGRPTGSTAATTMQQTYCVSTGGSTPTSGFLYSHGSNRASWVCNGYRNNTSPTNQWTSLAIGGNSGAAMIEMDPTGYMTFSTDSSKTTGSTFSVTERMRIANNGNVGIGDTNPTYRLSIDAGANNGIYSTTSALTTSYFVSTDSSATGLSASYYKDSATPVDGDDLVNLKFYGNNSAGTITEYGRITVDASDVTAATEDGRVSISVQNNSALTTAFFLNFTDGLVLNSSIKVTAPYIYSNTTATAANVNVDSSGVLKRSTSSLRYKTDITPATHGLDEVLALNPVTYKGINDGDTIFGGLIAEEVDALGLSEFVVYDSEGRPDALAYSNMVSLLIKAIQEQQSVIEELKTRVAAVEPK
jgi:hypothetical protein